MKIEKDIFKPEPEKSEEYIEKSLRPQTFEEYIGQKNIIKNLRIAILSAKKRKKSLDHILFYGPPGLGKTSLSILIAKEMGVNIKITSGVAIDKKGDLAAILTNLREKDILFIDEIHRLPPSLEEILYPAMEDFKIDIVIGEGPGAKTIRLEIPNFTLIGATTRIGLLTPPLRARFGIVEKLSFYKVFELKEIVKQSSKKLDISITDGGALEIAKRSRGIPRIANRLLKRVRDLAVVEGKREIDKELSVKMFDLLKIDGNGIDTVLKEFLLTIIEKFNGGPVGLKTLSAITGEEKDTIEDIYEPFLIKLGFLERTTRGRVITEKGYEYFGFKKGKKLF